MQKSIFVIRWTAVLILLLTIFFLSSVNAAACIPNVIGLRKEFRHSKRVFMGEVISIDDEKNDKVLSELLDDWKAIDKITFKVIRSWKGNSSAVAEIYSNVVCDCPNKFLKLEPGKKFLIFSDGRQFADACSLRVVEIPENGLQSWLENDIERLDSFWFRTWARIYPF